MNDFIVSLMLLGALGSSDGYLPYWATTNQYGLMPERNGELALLQAQSEFDESKTLQWKWGSSLALNSYENPLAPGSSPVHPMVDQLYGSLKWKMFNLDIGMKHRVNEFLGASERLGSLSVTGGHLVESGNARSMPGYLVTMEPVAVPFTGGHFLLSGAYGDYATTDNRYVKGALVHRMRIGFHGEINEHLSLSAVLDHYALWAGTHPDPEETQIARTFGNYLRVITGSHAGSDGNMGDRINVIGDQGGSEIFRAVYRGNGWTLTAQHDIPYADGSGMGFQNFPDGVNTIHFGWTDKDRWISDLLYEHQYTLFQSGPINGEKFDEFGNNLTPPGVSTTGCDNYFSNGYYRSGWTHYGRLIADPLILPEGMHEGAWSSALTNTRMESTRLKAHHLALGGKLFRAHPYKLMLTYSENFGTYYTPYVGESQYQKPWGTVKEQGLKQFSAAFVGEVALGLGRRSGAGVRTAATAGSGASSRTGSRAASRTGSRASSDSPARSARLGRLSALYGLYLDKGELYKDTFGCTFGVRYTIGE